MASMQCLSLPLSSFEHISCTWKGSRPTGLCFGGRNSGKHGLVLPRREQRQCMQVVASIVETNASPAALVSTLLALVEGTDRGTQIGQQEQAAVAEVVSKLENFCIPQPLESPLIFGDWDVAYSSNPTAPGGYYRSLLGRTVMKTREMVQTIAAPNGVINKVSFAAFGLFDGKVTLQGKLKLLDSKWVEVTFEPPTVQLGSFKLQYGGNSTVKLAIVYLDDVVRLGRGSRGSLFVFKRRA